MRPAANVLDRGNTNSLARLRYHAQYGMQYAVFACGIFYERFAPGGMAALQLGKGTYIDGEGGYLMNIRTMKAEIPYFNALGEPVCICMTSAQDLARYIVAALDLPQWTTEFRVCGERMVLGDVVKEAEIMRGELFLSSWISLVYRFVVLIYTNQSWLLHIMQCQLKVTNKLIKSIGAQFEKAILTDEALENSLAYAKASGSLLQQWRLHHLLATTAGSYDFGSPNLHSLVNVKPQRFRDWLHASWALIP